MDDATVAPARHRLTVEQYHRMADSGVFHQTDRIELLDGDLIDMAPIGESHAAVVGALTEVLILACAGRATVWPQNPVRLDGRSEPQPDLAVLRRRADFYAGELPGPADVLLLIEVADTSLTFDQSVKLPLYARAGIPELWIIDLKRRILHAHRNPAGDTYTEITTHHPGQIRALALAPEIVVTLSSAFP